MIQFGHDGLQRVAGGQEIDHIMVVAERAVHLGHHAIRMPVQPLALSAGKRDKVPGRENQIVAGDRMWKWGMGEKGSGVRDQGSEIIKYRLQIRDWSDAG